MTLVPQDRSSARSATYSRSLHFLAILTACALFPLIFVGAGVTSKDAGMAYPDGFTSDGYFLQNPPGWWESDDTRWEHGHRLVGRTVGILAIALSISCWRRGGWVRTLGAANLLAIVTQGVLGAFRVNEVSTTLAMIHGIFGQLCFCLACSVALVTGRTWHGDAGAVDAPEGESPRKLCVVATLGVFVQLVLGAAVRHFGANIALFAHVLLAMAVTFFAGWAAMWLITQPSLGRLSVRLGVTVALLLVVQLFSGGLAFTVTVMGVGWSRFVVWVVPSVHVAIGALFLAFMVLATMTVCRLLRSVAQPDGARFAVPVATQTLLKSGGAPR